MTTVTTTHYLLALNNAAQMLDHALENQDTLTADGSDETVKLMCEVQKVQTKINAVEKRLRESVAATYDCATGLSKSYSLESLNLKVTTKRPETVVLIDGEDFTTLTDSLGESVTDLIFPVKRSFSKTEYKKLSESEQADVDVFLTTKPGALAVKVTSLY